MFSLHGSDDVEAKTNVEDEHLTSCCTEFSCGKTSGKPLFCRQTFRIGRMNLPETSDQEITPTIDTTATDRLQELTSQSWNLELVISGAALFATLNLPDLVDSGLDYYRYNLMPDTEYIYEVVPAQVLGLIKGVSYLLVSAFLIHFVMRAFWVGLVGLLAHHRILNLPQLRENLRLAPFTFKLSKVFATLFQGLYQPLLYIMYTFQSRLLKPLLKRRLVWITDVIREPYVRLFVGYPKSLDAELTKRFREPGWPTNLTRKEQHERRAAWYIKALETYFGVYLNDSLYHSPKFLFMPRADN